MKHTLAHTLVLGYAWQAAVADDSEVPVVLRMLLGVVEEKGLDTLGLYQTGNRTPQPTTLVPSCLRVVALCHCFSATTF